MQNERIIEILHSWNFWQQKIETGILRDSYLEELERLEATGQIVVVTGVRRSGKSTIIKQYIQRLIEKGINSRNVLYINFEEPQFSGDLSVYFLQQAYEAYLEIIKPTEKPYIFLDEIQLIAQWEKFARALHEKKEATIFVSGSSAKLLSKELGTVLTGRHVDLLVYPLNFKEFLHFKNMDIKSKLDVLANKIKIKGYLREYLEFGGFPLVVLKEGKKEILTQYFDDIIVKDLVERYNIKKISQLKSLARWYLTNVSSLASFRRITPIIGVSLDSIERFSYYLTEAYFLYLVSRFSYKIREQEINPKKVYSIDAGLRNLVGFTFREDLGKLYENMVFLTLFKDCKEIFYWSNQYECDFVIKEGKTMRQLIQVCYDLSSLHTKEREVKALLKASEELRCNNLLIITSETEDQEKHGKRIIKYIPLWKWLLASERKSQKQ